MKPLDNLIKEVSKNSTRICDNTIVTQEQDQCSSKPTVDFVIISTDEYDFRYKGILAKKQPSGHYAVGKTVANGFIYVGGRHSTFLWNSMNYFALYFASNFVYIVLNRFIINRFYTIL